MTDATAAVSPLRHANMSATSTGPIERLAQSMTGAIIWPLFSANPVLDAMVRPS